MYLANFKYQAPESVAEACEALAKYGSRAKLISGGTDIIVKMKKELLAPEILVSIGQLPKLKEINYVKGKGLVIGACATHNSVMNSKLVQEKYLSVAQAAHQMAHNQVRNLGTVGGNICNAVPSADLPPILIALGATVTIEGTKGERSLPLEDVFVGPGQTSLESDEILTEFIIPDGKFTGSTYIKFGLRESGALAVVGVASAVETDGKVIKS
ncbi:MAG: FAD binding domain-containing protein, partial [Peptococcaceae bacterium]|nr:FAD binding domain-containing protein [Peptococcaceae bacterium]